MADLKLDIGGTLPGEQLLVKLLEAYESSRANMSQENRDGWDKLILAQAKGWHNWWIGMGWPGEKV